MVGRRARRAAAAIIATALFGELAVGRAGAHLLLTDASLVRGVERADVLVVARALSPTSVDETGAAHTRFAIQEALAGPAPAGEIEVLGDVPPLRYAAGDVVVVLLQHRDGLPGPVWRSAQVAGTALPIDGAAPGDPARRGLAMLWKATRGGLATGGTTRAGTVQGAAAGGESVGSQDLAPVIDALVALSGAPERKLHTVAALDLAELAHHPEAFSAADRTAIDGLLTDPHTDPGLRAVLAVTARSLANGAPPPAAETPRRSG